VILEPRWNPCRSCHYPILLTLCSTTPPRCVPVKLAGWLGYSCVSLSSFHSNMPVTSPHHCLTLSFVLIPSLILLSYFYAQFPHAPQVYSVHPSLASLGPETKAQCVYPEDFYPGGAYVSLPFGKVCPPFPPMPFLASPVTRFSPQGALLVARPRKWKEGSQSPPGDLFVCSNLDDQIVLIHGLSIPSLIWKDVAPTLASRGHRVLLYGMCTCVHLSSPTSRLTANRPLRPWLL
jgi:hypothetical protein